jgi:MraZ protein
MRALFANAAKCEPDAQGRILIPNKLREYAGLEREVIINGMSKCVELWSPQRWAPIETTGLDPDNLAEAMEELGF